MNPSFRGDADVPAIPAIGGSPPRPLATLCRPRFSYPRDAAVLTRYLDDKADHAWWTVRADQPRVRRIRSTASFWSFRLTASTTFATGRRPAGIKSFAELKRFAEWRQRPTLPIVISRSKIILYARSRSTSMMTSSRTFLDFRVFSHTCLPARSICRSQWLGRCKCHLASAIAAQAEQPRSDPGAQMEVPLPPGCHKRLGETVGFTSRDCLNGRRSTSAFAVIRASALVRRLTAAFRPFAPQPVSNDRSRRPPMRTPDPSRPFDCRGNGCLFMKSTTVIRPHPR